MATSVVTLAPAVFPISRVKLSDNLKQARYRERTTMPELLVIIALQA